MRSHIIALHCIALHCIALHCIALHCIALHCIALHCIALHCIALHCIALHCIALHCIVLYCIVLYILLKWHIKVNHMTIKVTLHYLLAPSPCYSMSISNCLSDSVRLFHHGWQIQVVNTLQWVDIIQEDTFITDNNNTRLKGESAVSSRRWPNAVSTLWRWRSSADSLLTLTALKYFLHKPWNFFFFNSKSS